MNQDSATRFRLKVLGLFELNIDGARVDLPLQAQRVLGYLAVVQPAQSRSVLAGSLWGDMPQPRAMATLRNALWRLRRASSALLGTSRDVVTINPLVRTDLAHARRAAASITSGAAADLDQDTDPPLIDLLDADLLITWDDDWLHIERERTRQLRIHALESLAEALLTQGRHAEAIQAALTAVRAEPLRESAQGALITAFLGEGNVCEAVRAYESFRRLLGEEMGLRPSARIDSLLQNHLLSSAVGTR